MIDRLVPGTSPAILSVLEDESVTLTTIRLLAPHLTATIIETSLASPRTKESAKSSCSSHLRPMPSVASTIRKLQELSGALLDPAGEAAPAALTRTAAASIMRAPCALANNFREDCC